MSIPFVFLGVGLCLFGLCLATLRFYGLAFLAAFEGMAETRQPNGYPSVTLLKSLDHLESDSYANLASFCQQDYPHYCIWLVVQQAALDTELDTEWAEHLIQQLMRQFPQADLQLVSPADLSRLRQASLSKLWVVADGNIRVGRRYLQQMVQPFCSASVGVVVCPRSVHLHPWLTKLAMLRTIELYARTLVARGADQVAGSSLAIRTDLLTKLAGSEAVTSCSQLMAVIRRPERAALGYRMVLSRCAVQQGLAKDADWNALKQQIAWAQERRRACPQRYLQQGLNYGTVYGLLLVGLTQGAFLGWAMLLCIWMAEYIFVCWVGWSELKEPAWRLGWLLPVGDLINFGLWICGFWGRVAESLPEQSESQAEPMPATSYAVDRQLSIR